MIGSKKEEENENESKKTRRCDISHDLFIYWHNQSIDNITKATILIFYPFIFTVIIFGFTTTNPKLENSSRVSRREKNAQFDSQGSIGYRRIWRCLNVGLTDRISLDDRHMHIVQRELMSNALD